MAEKIPYSQICGTKWVRPIKTASKIFLLALQSPAHDLDRKLEEVFLALKIYIICFESENCETKQFEQFLLQLSKSQTITTWRGLKTILELTQFLKISFKYQLVLHIAKSRVSRLPPPNLFFCHFLDSVFFF